MKGSLRLRAAFRVIRLNGGDDNKWLSDDYFLHFVVQFEDINTGCHVNGLADAANDGLAAEDATRHVNQLHCLFILFVLPGGAKQGRLH